jgi:malonyl CoA-acyl carrier protein transacylase
MARLAPVAGPRPPHRLHIIMPTACLFPGQGSQVTGMGADLFGRFPDWTAEADEVLGYSIRALCVDDADRRLALTTYTQPALFVVNALTWRARIEDGGAPPDFVAGHSLGEYNALLAAGAFDFADGLRMVRRRGKLMGQVTGGGMAAVIGLEPDRIEAVLKSSEAGRRLDVANFNSFDQTVIAGPTADLETVRPDFEAAGSRACIPLNVSAPFHSRYMREAEAEFSEFLQTQDFRPPAIPVISNVTAEPYALDAVGNTLAMQIGQSVRWLDSMLYLLDRGVTEFEEVGPGTVLRKLVAQIRKRRPAAGA